MTTLADLLRKIESASGADRELDLALGRLWPTPQPFSLSINQQRGGKPPVFAFTASIDAALSLVERVLPGANTVGFEKVPRGADAYVSRNHVNEDHWLFESPTCATPPLALLSACLRAKLSEQGKGER